MTIDQIQAVDERAAEAFAERLFDTYTQSMVTLMIDLAQRTGLLDAAAAGPGTSGQIAARAGLTERYVRECLGSLVTADIVRYDAATGTYSLPAEHVICLSGDGALNVAPMSQMTTLLAKTLGDVARAFREGGGVSYEAFRPDFAGVMDGASRATLDQHLLDHLVPLAGGLPDRLRHGIRVADIGCGSGHSTNLLARAYPRSRFVGYDISRDALDQARAEATEYRLDNVAFELRDVTTLPAETPLDAVFAFDAIHDQVDPATVLRRVYAALNPGGHFVMVDIKASSHLENNVGNPFAPWLYAVSTLHCLTVSLAGGGAGLGTVWGEELARQMLSDAGFVDIEIHDVPDDPFNSLYVARK